MDGEMTSKIIKQSAVRPSERFDYIISGDNNNNNNNNNNIISTLRSDICAKAFGLNGITITPQEVPALILPQVIIISIVDFVVYCLLLYLQLLLLLLRF